MSHNLTVLPTSVTANSRNECYTSISFFSVLVFNNLLTSGEKRSVAPVATASIRQNLTLEYSEARQSRHEFNCSQPDKEQVTHTSSVSKQQCTEQSRVDTSRQISGVKFLAYCNTG